MGKPKPGYYQAYYEGFKIRAMTHYSNGIPKCICCGKTYLDHLTIDHINGGGRKHRKELKLPGGALFYRWLEQNGYPPGYQTMCFCCNQAKQMRGRCGCQDHLTNK